MQPRCYLKYSSLKRERLLHPFPKQDKAASPVLHSILLSSYIPTRLSNQVG